MLADSQRDALLEGHRWGRVEHFIARAEEELSSTQTLEAFLMLHDDLEEAFKAQFPDLEWLCVGESKLAGEHLKRLLVQTLEKIGAVHTAVRADRIGHLVLMNCLVYDPELANGMTRLSERFPEAPCLAPFVAEEAAKELEYILRRNMSLLVD